MHDEHVKVLPFPLIFAFKLIGNAAMQLLHYSICVAEIEIDHVEIVAHAVSLDTPVSNKKKKIYLSLLVLLDIH